jgi:hypothetical protein
MLSYFVKKKPAGRAGRSMAAVGSAGVTYMPRIDSEMSAGDLLFTVLNR